MSSPQAMDDIIERNRRFEEYMARKSKQKDRDALLKTAKQKVRKSINMFQMVG